MIERLTPEEIKHRITKYNQTIFDQEKEQRLSEQIQRQEYVTKKQLQEIVEWKLARQGGRANMNKKRFSDVPTVAIENITRGALLVEDPKIQLKILNGIPGIGYATATVILAFHDPETYAVGDRIINEVAFGKEQPVTPTNYPDLLAQLRSVQPNGCSLRELEKALYVANYRSD